MTSLQRGMFVFLFCALLAAAVFAGDAPPPKAHGPDGGSLVVGGQGYFPVALRLADGRIAVVLRGGAGHLGIKGRLDMVFSRDEGRTWTQPTVVVDSPVDDRNPALGQARDGTLVVGFWRTATYDDKGRYDPKLDKPTGTWVTRSRDGGKTWSEATPIDVAEFGWGSPFGKIVTLPDGDMLMAIYGGQRRTAGEKVAADRDHSYLYRSTDNGQTWKFFSEIGDGKQQLNETALLRLSSGKLLAAIRSRAGDVWLSRQRRRRAHLVAHHAAHARLGPSGRPGRAGRRAGAAGGRQSGRTLRRAGPGERRAAAIRLVAAVHAGRRRPEHRLRLPQQREAGRQPGPDALLRHAGEGASRVGRPLRRRGV